MSIVSTALNAIKTELESGFSTDGIDVDVKVTPEASYMESSSLPFIKPTIHIYPFGAEFDPEITRGLSNHLSSGSNYMQEEFFAVEMILISRSILDDSDHFSIFSMYDKVHEYIYGKSFGKFEQLEFKLLKFNDHDDDNRWFYQVSCTMRRMIVNTNMDANIADSISSITVNSNAL